MVDPVINDLADHLWREGVAGAKEAQRKKRLERLTQEYLDTHTLWYCLGESCGIEGDKNQQELLGKLEHHLSSISDKYKDKRVWHALMAKRSMDEIMSNAAESWAKTKLWAEEQNAKLYGEDYE